jgi:two-component system, OmpR family, sensor histidine kinase KdpD
MADPALMERVIVNLARNALRYSPPWTPPLLTARARGGRVELWVVDRGPGIPRTERDRAFLPFQRLGDTGASPGVGLGLALSRGLTEAMGGMLVSHETPGGGLTMVISLPAARRTARAASATTSLGNGGPSTAVQSSARRPPRLPGAACSAGTEAAAARSAARTPCWPASSAQ